MSCPKCKSDDTEEVRIDPDIKLLKELRYEGRRYLVKICGHEHLFVNLTCYWEVNNELEVSCYMRLRYSFMCNNCEYEWDVLWPSMIEIDGKRIT